MKKVLSILLTIVLSLGVFTSLTACKITQFDAETVPVNVELPKDTSATLKMGIMDDASEKLTAKAFIDSFNTIYPNIKVELDIISGNYSQAMLSRISSKTVPDIFWVGDDTVSYFAEKKLLLNLDRYMDAAKFDKTAYYESMIKLGQKNQNGSQYMLPRDYNKVVVFYNKTILAQAGVAPGSELYPNDEWDYDQFLALCAKLKSSVSSGVYPVDAMLAWPPVFNSFIRSFGGELMTTDGKPAFNTAEAKLGLNAMKDLLAKGYSINPISKSEEIFLASKAAMWFAVRPMVSNCTNANLQFDVASFPKLGPNQSIGAGTSGYGISRSTKNPNEAWALLSYMLSNDGQQAFSTTGNAVPVLKSLASSDDAIWNTIPDIQARFNHAAFVKYDSRDTLKDYLNGVDVQLGDKVDKSILNLLDRYCGWTLPAGNPEEVLADKIKDINKILTSD